MMEVPVPATEEEEATEQTTVHNKEAVLEEPPSLPVQDSQSVHIDNSHNITHEEVKRAKKGKKKRIIVTAKEDKKGTAAGDKGKLSKAYYEIYSKGSELEKRALSIGAELVHLHQQILSKPPSKPSSNLKAQEQSMPSVPKKKSKKQKAEYKELHLKDGNVFKGQILNSGKKFNGTGEMVFPDGSLYKGAFVRGKCHGFGEKYWQDGKVYKGYWSKGKMNGKGELTLGDGEVYMGEFRGGFPFGKGIRKWRNGDLYEGTYVNGF